MADDSRTLYRQFRGGWCDICNIAATTKRCPGCGQPAWPAKVTVEPADDDALTPGQAALLRVADGVERLDQEHQ